MQEDYSPQPIIQAKYIRAIMIVAGLLLLSTLFLLWMHNNAFVKITVSNTTNQPYDYKIVDQKTGKTIHSESKSGSVKKRVSKGSYEVLVFQNGTSYYKVINTGSFLSTTAIKAELQPENNRSFVGNFPDTCPYYAQDLLYSYDCEGNSDALKIHLPATNKAPTAASVVDDALRGLTITGIYPAGGKNLVLLSGRNPVGSSDGRALISELRPDFSLIDSVVPTGIEDKQYYKIVAYKEGFVLYNNEFTDVLYYPSLGAKPEKISFEKPNDDKLQPFELIAKNDTLAAIYSYPYDERNFGENQTSNDDRVEVTKGKTVYQVIKNGERKDFTFVGGYTRAILCGQNNLCILNGARLTVYDIAGKKQKELFTVQEVREILTDNDKLVIVREKEVLSMDIASRTGVVGYSYGDYISCGGHGVPSGGYLLCIGGPKETKSTLYIDTKKANTDSIDKKVLSIADQPYIDTVSVYKSFIYIVPNLGEPIYDPAAKGYLPDPGVRQKTALDINKLIDGLNIDRKQYTIINTQP
ncbi:MAG: hypothetical protein ACR2FM_01840 [Candidatus Saccharimonadales bacterium]